jgi:hypothetical protein
METMRIASENRDCSILLEVVEFDGFYPGVTVSCAIVDGAFHGTTTTWLILDDVTAFLERLRACEPTRQGIATLQSASPGELVITIQSVDGLGHFVLEYRIAAGRYSRRGHVYTTLSGEIDLDSSQFVEILDDFQELLPTSGHGV